MSKLLANTLVILGARVRDAEERAKSNEYWAEISDKENKELKEKARLAEAAHFKQVAELRNDNEALRRAVDIHLNIRKELGEAVSKNRDLKGTRGFYKVVLRILSR
jgi:hypothetical protein